MNYTTNYNLKKPGYNDTADVGDLNDNFDVIDTTMKSISDHAGANSGNISTLMSQVGSLDALKQPKTDNTLGTTAKTVAGAINELAIDMARRTDLTCKPYFIHPDSIDTLKSSLYDIFDGMNNQEVSICIVAPTFNDHSVLGGWAQVCILMRYDSNVFHATFPSRGVDMYYHDGDWHTSKATMAEIEY